MHHLTITEREDILKQVSNEVKHFNFDLYFTSLSKYILSGEAQLTLQIEDIKLCENNEVTINEALKKSPNKTTREEIKNLYW